MNAIEVRIKKFDNSPTRVTVVYGGIGNTKVHWITANWRDWLRSRGLTNTPRIWE